MKVAGTGKHFRRAAAGAMASILLGVVTACSSPDPDGPARPLYRRDMARGVFSTAPVRGERGPLQLHSDGDAFACTMCHDGFTGGAQAAALEGQHSDITFDHGANLLCLNCHHPEKPDAYVYHDGSEIPGDQPTRLCAKCHGPHFREWEMGVHGRVNGYWDPRFGEQKYLDCIQCHDPHRPRFQRLVPNPPPVLTRFDGPAGEGGTHGG